MKKTFDYIATQTFESELEIDDIGNCVIKASAFDSSYYLWVKTELGFTRILQIGPLLFKRDEEFERVRNFDISYSKIEYSEYQITRVIKQFLNNYKLNIINAIEISDNEFIDETNLNIYDFMKSYDA